MTVQTPKIKSLQTAFFNARSLRTTRNELEVFADSHDLDVILVNETFLRADDPDPKIRGFTFTDRTNGAGGGTAIFIRRTLPYYPNALPALQNLEATAVTIETANGPLTLISCYHRPQDLLRENDITNILDTGASVIAAGDFNSKHLTWGSRETNRNGRILFDLADATDFLIEAPPEPTYYDSRGYRADILDIALIKNVPLQIRLHVSLALNSDHIGDEANDANTNITIRTTNWPRFAEILETDFGPITRIESVEDLESAAGPLEDKIGSLKKKAPGSDNISNTALKLLPPKVVVALAAIFNASLRLCHFPSRWKNATVIFIPKPGKNSKLPQSYRPISLLSSIGKVLEKVILTRLVKVTDENSTIPDEQFGFRPKHSTVDQLINVTEFIAKGFGQNQSTGAIFLDVAKAFDTVWHDGLVYKLHAAGVPLAMVRLLNSFLNRRVFHAKIGQVLSTQREIQAGVPQGSVLSPTLYAIFTADIPKPDNTKIALYADDTAILVRSWSPEIISRDLQGAVENLESWFRTWRIDVNPEKSSAILFTKRHFRPVGEVAMFNRVIPWTTVVKYLGVKFDNHLTFIPQIEHAKTRALIVRGQLNSLVCRRSKLSIKNKITIYRQIVRPAMTYGFVVWGNVSNTQLHKLQVVQNKFLRAAFNAPWFVRNSQLHREADLPLIKDFLLDVAEKFFENAAQHPNPLVRDAVDYDEHLPLRHKRPKCLLLRQD
jgi:hypothetical protein